MNLYFLTFFLLLLLLLGYFRLANIFNITDKPNNRSSHSQVTIRGGGIVFPMAALIWFVEYGFNVPWLILSVFIIAAVSFVDDLKTLSSKVRIVAHFTAVSVLFWQLNMFELQWFIVLAAYILTIGWINAFNFMDGINGITGIYGLVSLATFAWLNNTIEFVSAELINILIISAIIFLFFNARKQAKSFAGDVGSVSLAFLLAWFLIALIIKTGQVQYVLFFAVYGIDSVVTILIRLWRRENIFEAHRSHLYQYLCNELNMPHVLVAVIYGSLQLIINILTLNYAFRQNLTWVSFVVSIIILLIIYITTRILIHKYINREEYIKYAKNKG